VKNVGFKPGMK